MKLKSTLFWTSQNVPKTYVINTCQKLRRLPLYLFYLNLERDKQRIIVALIAVITCRWLDCQTHAASTVALEIIYTMATPNNGGKPAAVALYIDWNISHS